MSALPLVRRGRKAPGRFRLGAALLAAGSLFGVEASAAPLTFAGLEGSLLGQAGQMLRDPGTAARLGLDGVIDGGERSAAQIAAGGLSGTDLFFTGVSGMTTSLSSETLLDLTTYVEEGGALVIHADRAATGAMAPLLSAFGAALGEANGPSAPLTIDAPSAPLMDGPFGRVDSLAVSDSASFRLDGPELAAMASYASGAAAIAVLPPDAAAGRLGLVVLLPDVECFLRFSQNCGGLGAGDYDIALANALAYGLTGRLSADALADLQGDPVPLPGAALLFGPLLLGGILRVTRRGKAG